MRMAFRATATATALALSWAAAVGCSSGGAKTHAAAETATAAPDAGGRGILDRLTSVPRYLQLYFGVPSLALAAWGAALLWRRHARDRTSLTSTGWLLTCGLFLVLGILTPVDMRYYLAAIPAIALFAAAGAAIAWTSSGPPRAVAVALLAGTVFLALRSWWSTLS